jgi:hypothetical protein
MGTWAEIKDLWNDIKTDKIMKQIGRGILFVGLLALVISLIFYCIDWGRGRHARLFWGLAENDPKPDTSYIIKHETTYVFRHDSIPVFVKIPGQSGHEGSNPGKNQSKYDLKDSKFYAPAQVGDHNAQTNNYNGIKQRVLTQEKLNEIGSHIPNKSARIKIFLTVDKECRNYAEQIINVLKGNGCTNIDWTFWGDPSCFDDITYGTIGDSIIRINVCPASNVNTK